MRTSKVSQETTKIFSSDALSHTRVRRSTRQAAKTISAFALASDANITKSENVKKEAEEEEEGEGEGAGLSTDIEDSVSTSTRSLGKRKRASESPATTLASATASSIKTRTTPRGRVQADVADDDERAPQSPSRSARPKKASAKTPARKITHPDGRVTIQPPANWEAVYDTIKAMRLANPIAPVDTMGCEDLHWRAASPREQRYHTLTALMLSSQTKDTVTAAAMQRLHTELVPSSASLCPPNPKSNPNPSSTLTIANMLNAAPSHLDALISKVGFHNTKTRHLQQTAHILHDDFASDIPRTLDDLLRLPGVGPKMAYLALSAAWGIDEGIGVDVHVHRITNLWGWHATRNPEETRKSLEAWLPRGKWHEINRLLVGLGQTVCLPVGRRCGECALGGSGLCKGEVRGGWKSKG